MDTMTRHVSLPNPDRFLELRFESIGGLGAHAAGQIVGFTSAEESGLAAVMVWGDYLCTDHSWGHTCFEQMPPGSCGVYYSLTQHSGPGSASSHLIEPCEDE